MTAQETVDVDELTRGLAGLKGAEAPRRGPQCTVGALIDRVRRDLGDQAADAITVACDDPDIAPAALAGYLADRFPNAPTVHTLRRHRKRAAGTGCRCPR